MKAGSKTMGHFKGSEQVSEECYGSFISLNTGMFTMVVQMI